MIYICGCPRIENERTCPKCNPDISAADIMKAIKAIDAYFGTKLPDNLPKTKCDHTNKTLELFADEKRRLKVRCECGSVFRLDTGFRG